MSRAFVAMLFASLSSFNSSQAIQKSIFSSLYSHRRKSWNTFLPSDQILTFKEGFIWLIWRNISGYLWVVARATCSCCACCAWLTWTFHESVKGIAPQSDFLQRNTDAWKKKQVEVREIWPLVNYKKRQVSHSEMDFNLLWQRRTLIYGSDGDFGVWLNVALVRVVLIRQTL